MRKLLGTGAILVVLSTSLTSCGTTCGDLQATEKELAAAKDGFEVERESTWGKCELSPDGSWHLDD